MKCPAAEKLAAFLDAELAEAELLQVSEHVDRCAACRATLEAQLGDEPFREAAAAPGSLSQVVGQQVAEAHRRGFLSSLVDDDRAGVDAPVHDGAAELPEWVHTASRFRLVRTRDSGGLSVVYEFQEPALGRRVALKVLRHDRQLSADARRRFMREYRVTGGLDHPGVAPVYGVGRLADGRDFFTMRLVGGTTLGWKIREFHARGGRPLRQDRAFRALLESLRRACETIDYAHRQGILHRDLKPENIQVAEGETIVLDWGLAGRVGDEEFPGDDDPSSGPLKTRAGQRVGSPAYMSPEQAAGGGAELDRRTDIYGLGTILFEILSGRPPHGLSEAATPQSLEALFRRIAEQPTPRAGLERAPAELASICARAMARDKASRYDTAAEVAEELARWLAYGEVESHDYGIVDRAALAMQRHRDWSVAVGLILVVLSLVSSAAAIVVSAARRDALEAQQQTRVEIAAAQSQRVSAAADLAAAYLAAEVDNRWRLLEGEAGDDALRALLRLSLDAARREEAIRALQLWNDRRFARYSPSAQATSWFIVNREGTLLARNPVTDDAQQAIGANFSHRDYFHGRGPLSPNDGPPDDGPPAPLEDVRRSDVFRSQVTRRLMVAFSVPVWSDGVDAGNRQVLGVLGMTIEMGRFDALRQREKLAPALVLVDGRENQLDTRARRGLILHHPLLEQADLAVFSDLPLERLAANAGPLPEYQDPLSPRPAHGWVACARRVEVASRVGPARETGLWVVVQEPATPR